MRSRVTRLFSPSELTVPQTAKPMKFQQREHGIFTGQGNVRPSIKNLPQTPQRLLHNDSIFEDEARFTAPRTALQVKHFQNMSPKMQQRSNPWMKRPPGTSQISVKEYPSRDNLNSQQQSFCTRPIQMYLNHQLSTAEGRRETSHNHKVSQPFETNSNLSVYDVPAFDSITDESAKNLQSRESSRNIMSPSPDFIVPIFKKGDNERSKF